MKNIYKRFNNLILLLILIIMIFQPFTVYGDDVESDLNGGRVLFISSYSYSWDTVPLQIEGIEEALGKDVYRLQIHEYQGY